MKKLLFILIGVGLIVISCKKKSTEPEKTEIDKNSATSLAPAVAYGFGNMQKSFLDPKSLAPTYLLSQGSCEPDISGDTTDADMDGIPVNATFNYDCNISYPGGTMEYLGTLALKDKDDSDPTGGFYCSGDLHYKQEGLQNIEWRQNFEIDVNKSGGAYSGEISFGFEYQGIEWNADFEFTYNPEDPTDPYVAGTLNFEGTYSFTYEGKTYPSLTIKGENLVFVKTGCAYPESGKITVSDGKNSLMVEYNCSSYKAYYNGSPLPVAY